MIQVLVGTAVVVLINVISIVVVAPWIQKKKPRWHGSVFLVGFVVRLAVFFAIAHIIWIQKKSFPSVVSFIFLAAISQMVVQIYLHQKGKI